MQFFNHNVIQPFFMQHLRNSVNSVGILRGDHRPRFDIGEQGNLAPFIFGQRPIGAAQQHIRLDTDGTQFFHRMLRGLGFDFPGSGNIGQQGQMHVEHIVMAHFHAHLANGLKKRQGFDVTDGAADFDHGHIGIACAFNHAALDFIGDMRDHLHRAPEVVAAPFLADHVGVDAPGGEVIALLHGGMHEAFVVTQIQIGFRAVFGDKHFTMLERTHGARIDIDVGIQFQQGDIEPA